MMLSEVQSTKPVPGCPLFYLTKGLFPLFILTSFSTVSTLYLVSLFSTHGLFYSLVVMSSPLYPGRLWLRSSSNTQQFAKSQGQVRVTLVRNKTEGNKLESSDAAALDDWLWHGLVPVLTEPWGKTSSDHNHYHYTYFLWLVVFGGVQ